MLPVVPCLSVMVLAGVSFWGGQSSRHIQGNVDCPQPERGRTDRQPCTRQPTPPPIPLLCCKGKVPYKFARAVHARN